MLTLTGLEKRYGKSDAQALAGIDLELGTMHTVILGPNGAGKSTLFRLILGLDRQTAGQVRWKSGARPVIGYAPEHAVFPARVTFAEVFGMAGVPAETASEWAGTFQIAPLLLRRIERLSKGERQRASLALAFSTHAPLLVLDEPFEGLDPIVRPLVRSGIVRALSANSGSVVIASTHRIEEVDAPFERVIVLNEGRVVQDMRLSELRAIEACAVVALDASLDGHAIARSIASFEGAGGPVRAVAGFRDNLPVILAGPFLPQSVPESQRKPAGLESLLQLWLGESRLPPPE